MRKAAVVASDNKSGYQDADYKYYCRSSISEYEP